MTYIATHRKHIKGRMNIRLFCCLLFVLSAVCGWCQGDILSTDISIDKPYVGSTDSLINIVSHRYGVTVSYSSKVYANRSVKLERQTMNLRSLLDCIFSRFPVEYVVRGNRVIVTQSKNRLYTVSGYCRDALSNEVLIGANVYDTLLYVGQATNGYGFFSIKLPGGNAALRTSFVGYRATLTQIDLCSDTLINVYLKPSLLIKDVDVVVNSADLDMAKTGVVDLPLEQIKSMPTLLGETDVIKALEWTPGVQCGEEGFGGMSVRGGSSDQNIVMLDDVPLYSPNHLMGLYSVFNSESVNSATLIKGGFPSRYGGRLSSVLDVRMKEGNMKKFSGYVNVGLLASNATLEGPIIPEKISFIVSARRTYFDMLGSQIQRNNDNRYSFNFYDISAKLNYAISARDHVYISFFTGYDNLKYGYNFRDVDIQYSARDVRSISINDSQKIGWGNIVSSARWNHVYGLTLFSNATISFSRYRFRNTMTNYANGDDIELSNGYFSGINDFGGRIDYNWYTPFIPGSLRFGINATYHSFYPGVSVYSSSNSELQSDTISQKTNDSFYRLEAHGYIEDELKYGSFSANVGVHLSSIRRESSSLYVRVEPRILLGYKINSRLYCKLGYADMTQFLHLLRMISVASPADMWMPISFDLPIPHARLYSAELNVELMQNIRLTMEVYHKKYINYQTSKTTSMMTETIAAKRWDDMYSLGEGHVDGLEFFLHRKSGRFSGWLGYAFSRGENCFDDINEGKYYPMDNDRTHSTSVYCCYNVREGFNLAATWSYSTGAPTTISDSRYTVMGSQSSYTYPMEGERNAYRMADSHTLNIGANITKYVGRTERKLSFGVYNVYGRKNPMFVYWKADSGDSGAMPSYKLKQFSLIAWPWPYIKYSIKF